MDFIETGWDGMDWIHLVHIMDQLVAAANPVTYLQVP
jgi:hypothetical protein